MLDAASTGAVALSPPDRLFRMAKWLVSYTVVDPSEPGVYKPGATEMPMDQTPAGAKAIHQLADSITESLRKRDAIGPDQFVAVLGWSPMGK